MHTILMIVVGFFTLSVLIAFITCFTKETPSRVKKGLGAFLLICISITLYNGYWAFHDTPEEIAAKQAGAEKQAKFDACWHKNTATDTARRTTAMAVALHYKLEDKMWVIQGKDDADLVYMFCEATSSK